MLPRGLGVLKADVCQEGAAGVGIAAIEFGTLIRGFHIRGMGLRDDDDLFLGGRYVLLMLS